MQMAVMVSIGIGTMAATVAAHSREKLEGQGVVDVTWRLRRRSSICMLACMLCIDMSRSSCVKLYLAARVVLPQIRMVVYSGLSHNSHHGLLGAVSCALSNWEGQVGLLLSE